MCVQRAKAEELGIKFKALFPGIQNNGKRGYSPVVCADEQRVMQVLLNLQSNALKFT